MFRPPPLAGEGWGRVSRATPRGTPPRRVLVLRAATALDVEDARGVAAENRRAFTGGQRGAVDNGAGVRVADPEREVGAEHHLVGAGNVAKEAQGARLE